MEKQKSVKETIEEVCEQICNDYCKYSVTSDASDASDGTCGHYDDCPLNKLG
jgi:hypothetical protein